MDLSEYNKPPLTEVVFGITYEPLSDLKAPHIGLYWNKIRDEYPTCQHMPPMGNPPPISKNWQIPLPLTWFISEDESHLIQLQNGRFLLNWRKLNEDTQYPRYSILKENFERKLSEFIRFIEQEENMGKVQFKDCELTYINHIYYNELLKSPADLGNIFPDLEWKKENKQFLCDPIPQAWRLQFPLPEDYGQLIAEVTHGRRREDDIPLFVLQLSVRGLGQKNEWADIWNWYNMSHEWIIKGFADLTSQKAQEKLWEKTY